MQNLMILPKNNIHKLKQDKSYTSIIDQQIFKICRNIKCKGKYKLFVPVNSQDESPTENFEINEIKLIPGEDFLALVTSN